ncbi:hypothetical protein CVT24_006124 [Panaeolus cyanescens]|uniref:Protein-S-isoprenylcysteine O-methyltransferase n=1 Tax=Panaeolus cyanescens TaxID=181874 RepID=A0A409YDT7_9AGAR|nr:hypothetical protein CVT24_006124 [Panaeolus cyanescens]
MDSEGSLKIVLCTLLSYLFFRGYNPPHPPLDEKHRDRRVKGLLTSARHQHAGAFIAYMQLALGIAEISLIIAKTYPSSRFSSIARTVFLFDHGDPTRLMLSNAHLAGGLMIILGGAIRVWAMNTLGTLFRFQIGIQEGHKLITTGPYRIVRHPSYLGVHLTHVGYIFWHLTPGSWIRESGIMSSTAGMVGVWVYTIWLAVMVITVTVTRMMQEDEMVKRSFGKEWDEWAARVRPRYQYIQLVLGLAEISLIITKTYPSSHFATLARSLFLFQSGDPSKMRLSTTQTIGGILITIGGLLRVWAMHTLGKLFSFQVGIQDEHKLVTKGPYRIVRHPSYMGMQLTHVGYLMWHLTRGSWVRESGVMTGAVGKTVVGLYVIFVVSAAYIITIGRMRQEDRMMQQQFGKAWEQWAARVRYRVMPGIY